MALVEIFIAVVIAGVSCINATPPALAWSRSRDGRFLFLATANLGLAALGALWAWGQVPGGPSEFGAPSWPVLLLVLVVTLLLLGTALVPRHS